MQQRELFKKNRLLKLGEVERRLALRLEQPPTRPTLIGYITSGHLVGRQNKLNDHYYVFESDLEDFINKYFPAHEQIAA